MVTRGLGKWCEFTVVNFAYVVAMKLPRGFSFSLSRALRVDVLKRRIARKTGIPLTRNGRQRKIGRMFGMK